MNSRNHMNMQKFATFVEKDFKINMLNIKKIIRNHCHYTGEYRGAAKEFEGRFNSLGENTEKIHNLFTSDRKISYKN